MGIATGLLVQQVGPVHQTVAFLSKQLDRNTKGWQPCLRALAVAAYLAKEALKLTLQQAVTYTPLIVYRNSWATNPWPLSAHHECRNFTSFLLNTPS